MKDRRIPRSKRSPNARPTSPLLSLSEQADVRWGVERMQSAAKIDPSSITSITVDFFPATIGESIEFKVDNNTDLRDSIRRLAKERKASSVFLAMPIELNGRAGVMFHMEIFFAASMTSLFSMQDGEQWHEFGLHTKLGRLIDAPDANTKFHWPYRMD